MDALEANLLRMRELEMACVLPKICAKYSQFGWFEECKIHLNYRLQTYSAVNRIRGSNHTFDRTDSMFVYKFLRRNRPLF